jgi:hypothetical protein
MPWPTGPFYIMSQLQCSNYVLAPKADGDQVGLQRLTSTIEQLWKATPDPRGGAFVQHAASGRVLLFDYDASHFIAMFMGRSGGPIKLVPLDPSDGRQRWVTDGDPWVNLSCVLRPGVAVDVYNFDPNGTVGMWGWEGSPNQWWMLLPETGVITVGSVSYDFAHAAADLTSVPPQHCAETSVDNTHGGTPVTSTYALARSVTTMRAITHAESDTTSQKYTQTFGLKGGLDKVFEVSASASFEESTSKTMSLTDQRTESETVTDTITTQVNVPPGKKYAYHVAVYYGKVSVPYTATMTFQSSVPGSAPVPLTTQGVFQGVNAVRNEIVVSDETAPQPAVVRSLPAPLATDGARAGSDNGGKAIVIDAAAPQRKSKPGKSKPA